MASETNNDNRDGVFIPKGAAYLLGPKMYEQVLQDNNFFLTTVATILVNLEYEAWFAIIDPHNNGSDPISLHEHLLRKPWFLRIESVGKNKCLVVTTRPNLPEARSWIDENLEMLIRKSIPSDIDPPASLLLRRLDKPVYSASSQTYADILKKQFLLVSTPQTTTTENNKPSRKRHASILDYDSDKTQDYPPLGTSTTTTSNTNNPQPNTTPTPTSPTDYATDIMSIKTELSQLKQIIAQAVEQITTAIAAIRATPSTSTPMAMETDNATTMSTHNPTEQPTLSTPQPDLQATINELKHEIATITQETRAMFQKLLPPTQMTNTHYSSAT